MNQQINANVWRLTIAQAMAGANTTVVYATGALIGNALAPSPFLATLPISVFVAGMAASTLPAGMLARRFGRRLAFMLGTLCGVLMGLIAAWAIAQSSFLLFCLAMPFGGAYAAIVLTFRFAATESVPPEGQARALSFVMAGGVAAGVVGPQLVIHTANLIHSGTFAATYLASSIVALLSAFVLRGVILPRQASVTRKAAQSALAALRHPKVLVAIICGAVSYTLMNFLMTSAPLAMHLCGLPAASASSGIQWHVIAMYAPGFVAGRWISRFGATRITLLGFALMAAAAIAGVTGISVPHFWASLIFLGVGWNFSFIGASSMLLKSQTAFEKTQLQALNDFVIFGCVMIGSLLSGGLLNQYGWPVVCLLSLAPIAAAVAFLLGASRRGHDRPEFVVN